MSYKECISILDINVFVRDDETMHSNIVFSPAFMLHLKNNKDVCDRFMSELLEQLMQNVDGAE